MTWDPSQVNYGTREREVPPANNNFNLVRHADLDVLAGLETVGKNKGISSDAVLRRVTSSRDLAILELNLE